MAWYWASGAGARCRRRGADHLARGRSLVTAPTDELESKRKAAEASAFVLVVVSPSGTGRVPLPAVGTLVLGRARDCDVPIEDAKLSRRHAEVRCGQAIEFVDLGSRNGSHVRGERASPNVPTAIRPGDTVSFGSTVLTLQRASATDKPRHIWNHGYFEARLEEECARAARDGTSFSVLRLRLEPEHADAPTTDAAAATGILAELDAADMVASYAPGDYEALFANTGGEEAAARMADRIARLSAFGASVIVAVCPRDGRTPDALVEHATRAFASRHVHSSRGFRVGVDPVAPSANEVATLPLGAFQRMDPLIRRIAAGAINVLVLGETGVGKDVLARRIHALSPRAKMPFVPLNCGALAETLLESELFGYEKGAFTGALQAKSGLLESAHGGTVFLDEIGEMPPATQVKLLRVLEQREVMRVGALRARVIDVRVIAATNRNLETEVAEKRFRQDLFFRLNGISVSIPPLRDRKDEIEPLAELFIDQACRAMARTDRPSLAPAAKKALLGYAWPGNVRELKNVIERALLLCSGGMITGEHVPADKMSSAAPPRDSAGGTGARPPLDTLEASPQGPAPLGEEQRIADALEACAGNQSQAAKRLGISRATLIRRLEEYAIRRPRKRI
jgi:DNA-binding NtrC family response regulator